MDSEICSHECLNERGSYNLFIILEFGISVHFLSFVQWVVEIPHQTRDQLSHIHQCEGFLTLWEKNIKWKYSYAGCKPYIK